MARPWIGHTVDRLDWLSAGRKKSSPSLSNVTVDGVLSIVYKGTPEAAEMVKAGSET
jgi:hypothetical protein